MIGTRADMATLIFQLLKEHEDKIAAETDGTEFIFESIKVGLQPNILFIKMKEGNEFQVRVE